MVKSPYKMTPLAIIDQSMFKQLEEEYGVSLRVFSQALSGLSGDFWGGFKISEYEFGLYIVDFCGHGMVAALHAARLYALMESCMEFTRYPDKYITMINQKLYKTLQAHEYATMFYGVVNVKEHTLRYTTAGNPPVMRLGEKGLVQMLKQGVGVPMGIDPKALYDTKETPFLEHEALFLYSDALIETKDKQGHYLDDLALCQLLKERADIHKHIGGGKRFHEMFKDLVVWIKERYLVNLQDDLTLCLVVRNALK